MFYVEGTWQSKPAVAYWDGEILGGPDTLIAEARRMENEYTPGPEPLSFDHPDTSDPYQAAMVLNFLLAPVVSTDGPTIDLSGEFEAHHISVEKHPGKGGTKLHANGTDQSVHASGRISPFNRSLHGVENTLDALPDVRGLAGRVIKKWEKTTGATRDVVADRYRQLIINAMEQPEYEDWRDWYGTAHDIAESYALKDGFTVEQSAAIISALSPGMTWEENAETAGELMDLIGEDAAVPAEILETLNAKLAKDAAKVGRSKKERTEPTVAVEGMKLSEFTSPRDATLALAEIARHRGMNWNAQYGYKSYTNAMLLARDWGSPDTILSGVKTRSFYNNILMPQSPLDVTIDFQMMEAGAGRQLTDNEESSLNGTPSIKLEGRPTSVGVRPYLADITRQVAAEFDLLPLQAQALIWNQWKREK